MEALYALICLIPLAAVLIPILLYLRARDDLDALRSEVEALSSRLGSLESTVLSESRGGARHPAAPPSRPAEAPRPAEREPSASALDVSTPRPPEPASGPLAASAAGATMPPAERSARAASTLRGPDAAGLDLPGKLEEDARPKLRLEEMLGTRLYVWLGAIALSLAGVFLVRYAIDQGWLGPAVRVGLALAFGVSLLGAGERLRDLPRIGSAFSAAAIAVLFAAVYAAAVLYGLIPAMLGFALMGLTAAGGVLLSLRQGQIVAVVGLVGGYLTPQLVQPTAEPSRLLFAYLTLLLLSVLLVSRKRDWWHLSALGLVAGLAWVQLWLSAAFEPADTIWLGLFVLGSLVAFLLAAARSEDAEAGAADAPSTLRDYLGQAALGLSLLAQLRLTVVDGFGLDAWLFVGLIGAAGLILARLREAHRTMPWLTLTLTAGLLWIWSDSLSPDTETRFLMTLAAFGLLYAGGGWLALWGTRRPDLWALLSAASAVGLFLLAYFGLDMGGGRLPWGLVATLLAGSFALLCLPVGRRRRSLPEGDAALAWLAAAATAFLSLAAVLELPDEWLAVAWSLELAALCWLAWKLNVPQMRKIVWPLAGLTVLGLLDPAVARYEIGGWPVLNWLLYGYGLPILALATGAFYAHRAEDASLSKMLQALATLLGVVMLALQVRQTFSPNALTDFGGFDFVEASTYGTVWLLAAIGLLRAGRRWPLPVLGRAGSALTGLALASLLLGPALGFSPLLRHVSVGETPILNWLAYAYGLPALLGLYAASQLAEGDASERGLAMPAAITGLLLGLLLITLNVRQVFHGAYLDAGLMSAAESYSYSLAWVISGVLLLVVGVNRGWRVARWASLPVMLLAVSKVFLYDTANLGGLFRVLSFLGLGLSLILLGWFYQSFVFDEDH